MTQRILAVLTIFTFFAFASNQALAQEREAILEECTLVFGGGESCIQSNVLTINKKVLNPSINVVANQQIKSSDFIENMNDGATIGPNTLTAFQLTVTNTGKNPLKNITVTDRIPQNYMTYVTSQGKYDEKSRTITFNIPNLEAEKSQTFVIQVMTMMSTNLPSNTVCVTNQAQANLTNERFFIIPDENILSQDNSLLCIAGNKPAGNAIQSAQNNQNTNQAQPKMTKGGLPITSSNPVSRTPDTGAKEIALLALIPAGILGYYLRKKN